MSDNTGARIAEALALCGCFFAMARAFTSCVTHAPPGTNPSEADGRLKVVAACYAAHLDKCEDRALKVFP